jgi:hypothetical protein
LHLLLRVLLSLLLSALLRLLAGLLPGVLLFRPLALSLLLLGRLPIAFRPTREPNWKQPSRSRAFRSRPVHSSGLLRFGFLLKIGRSKSCCK